MQLESLQVYCDIVRLRSFSQAASANGLSQSAASQIVSQLEERLGVQLIDRSTRPLQPTARGQLFCEGCRGLLEEFAGLEARVRQGPGRLTGTVQVAAIYSVGLGDMGELVERFRAAHPGVKVAVEYLHPDRVYERVLDGTADFGLVSWPKPTRKLVVLPWREEEMVLACAPRHPLARQADVNPSELSGVRYVGFDRDLAIRREVDRFLRDHEAFVDMTAEFDNIENIKQAVEVGAGVALLPAPTVQREVQAGTLAARPLAGCRFVRPLGIIHRRLQPLGTSARQFVELLRTPAPDANPGPNGRRNGASLRGRNGIARAPKRSD
jgi:DNA-binding transcriptional LysR family regulator